MPDPECKQDKTVIWLCVSQDEQNSPNRTSIETQLEYCQRHCTAAGDVVAGVLQPETEKGFSRFYNSIEKMTRVYLPYRQLVEFIEQEHITKTVAYCYDRYWRTMALAAQLSDLAEEHDVWLASATEPTTRESWMENIWVRVIHSVQPEEAVRKLARDRRRGMAGRADRGLPVQSTRPYGLRLVGRGKDRELRPVDDEWPHLVALMEWRAQGWGAARALRELERLGIHGKDGRAWTERAIRYIWHNPVYAGYTRVRLWPRRPKTPRRGEPIIHLARGKHPALISDDLWTAVQAVNSSRARDYVRDEGEPHLFTGLCRCGYCGGGMTYSARTGAGRLYGLSCGNYMRSGGRECRHNGHSEARLREDVIDWLRAAVHDPEAWTRAQEEPGQQDDRARAVEALEREIAGIDLRRNNLIEAVETAASGADRAQFLQRYDSLGERRTQCVAELEKLRDAARWIQQAQRRLISWQEAAAQLEHWPDAELRTRLLQLVDHIVLSREHRPVIVLRGQ